MAARAVGRSGNVPNRLARRLPAVMATRAVAGHALVIEAHRGPAAGSVALLAAIVARDVIGRLTRRLPAVVAGGAIALDAGVVELCAGPRGRRVTLDAIVAAGNVVGGLAHRLSPVVTAAAAAQHRVMVHHAVHPLPVVGVVARLALLGGGEVRGGANRSRHALGAAVTPGARSRQPLEDAAGVAALAANASVRAAQWEPGPAMVEHALRLGGRQYVASGAGAQHECRHDQHRRPHPPCRRAVRVAGRDRAFHVSCLPLADHFDFTP